MDRILQIVKTYGIIFVLVLAFLLRFVWISKAPPSLNWDEAALGYNAYSILKTGADEWGAKFPLSLRSFDDFKPAPYSYLAIIFIKFLGLNAMATRLPSVIAGTITVGIIYLIAKLLFDRKVALISALLIAIEPWSIHFSRAAFEANLALTFYLVGIYFLIKSKLKNLYVYAGVFFLTISAYTYHAEKILILPTLLTFLLIYRENIKKIIITTTILMAPLIIYQLTNLETFSRLGSTFLLKYPIERYFSYFSPINLFVRGTPEPTQHIPGFGPFYTIEFFFWVAGMFTIFKNFKKEQILPLIILLCPIPAVITFNWFYPARVLPLFAFYSIVIAVGITRVKLKWPVWTATSLFWLSLVSSLIINLLFYLPYQERGNWQYGMQQLAESVEKYQNSYQKVVIETRTAQPYIFLLFYTGYPPAKYQLTPKDYHFPRSSFNFDKYEFRDVYWDHDKNLKNILFAAPESSLPLTKITNDPNVNLVYDITDSDGAILYRIVGTK